MCHRNLPTIIVTFIYIALTLKSTKAFEPHLNVTIFPVGEGDATIVECTDKPNSVSVTLVNAGSMNARKGEIQLEYFEYLENKLKSSHYYIKNIILTSSGAQHYNFIEPLMIFIKEEDVKDISFYIGGERSSYISLDHIFQTYGNVYEFTRQQEIDDKVNSCGHLDKKENFIQCVKRNKKGPIPKSNQVIQICDNFQISVMAANYGFSTNNKEDEAESQNDKDYENNLILKITPSELPSPSVLLGDIGDEWEDEESSNKYDKFLKQAHSHYFTRSPNVPQSLWNGLTSTLMILPRNGALTTNIKDANFYPDFVQPQYAVVSSDVTDLHGHPRCSVLRLLSKYTSKFSTKTKKLQCHEKKPKDLENTQELLLSDNLYQTSTIKGDQRSRAEVAFKMISFKMTQKELSKPVEEPVIRKKRYDIDVDDIIKMLARVRDHDTLATLTVHELVDNITNGGYVRYSPTISNCSNVDDKKYRNQSKCVEYYDNMSNEYPTTSSQSKLNTKRKNKSNVSDRTESTMHMFSDSDRNSSMNYSSENYSYSGTNTTRVKHHKRKHTRKHKQHIAVHSAENITTTTPLQGHHSHKNLQESTRIYKKYTITGRNWEDVSGLNDVSNQDYNLHNYRNGENADDRNTNNEYWEDLSKHSEPSNHEEDENENNIMYNYNQHHGPDNHGEEDLSNIIYNNQNEKHNNRDHLNDELDDMTMHMRRFNEYPSYQAATNTANHNDYPNYESTPNPDNRNVERVDDFDYQKERGNSYPHRKMTYHQPRADRDREDFAFVHGVSYNQNNKGTKHEKRKNNEKQPAKYLEDDFPNMRPDETLPQRYESVSNEYPSHNDRERETSKEYGNHGDNERETPNEYVSHNKQTPYFLSGHEDDKSDEDPHSHFHYSASQESERGSHNQEKGRGTTSEEKGRDTTSEEKQRDNTSQETGRHTTSEEKLHVSPSEEKGHDTTSEEKGRGSTSQKKGRHRASQNKGRGKEGNVETHQEEMENQFRPTNHGHNQGEMGELGDNQESSEKPHHHHHTTMKVTINTLVKALASMKNWNTEHGSTAVDIFPSTKQSPHTTFAHSKQYRKGIPTPLRKKNHHHHQQFMLKPTKSFRERFENQHTSRRHHKTTKHQRTTKRKTTKHQKSTRHQKTTKHQRTTNHRKTTKHTRKPTAHLSRTRGKNTKKTTKPAKTTTSKGRKNEKENPHSPSFLEKLQSSTTLGLPLHDRRMLNILCFGDSLTAGYNKRGKDLFPYCSVLKDMLSSKTDIPINIDIRGIVGEMTHKQMSFRLPLVLGNATSQYDWIIILGGTNDILHVKNFADDQYFLSQLENVWQPRITNDIEKLHLISYKYDARTLLLTVPENAIESWPEYKLLRRMRVKINEALKHFADTSNGRTVLCDTAKIVPRHSLSSEEESLLWDDHVHMTRDGYVRLARAVAQCLLPYLPARSPEGRFHEMK